MFGIKVTWNNGEINICLFFVAEQTRTNIDTAADWTSMKIGNWNDAEEYTRTIFKLNVLYLLAYGYINQKTGFGAGKLWLLHIYIIVLKLT